MNLVNGIGTLRNRLSNSHGRGGKTPIKPSVCHAKLKVRTAGTIANFLIETHLETKAQTGLSVRDQDEGFQTVFRYQQPG